jgi:hypothetical protein
MSTLRFGTIRAYDAGTHTASVEITGYAASLLEDVPVADNIAAGLMVGGVRCVVAFNDPYNPADAVIVAVF